MSDSRKLFLALAGLALLMGSAASAQTTPPIVCNTTAQPLTARTEGLTEMTGDVIILCTGGGTTSEPTPAGAALPQVNISVTLSTNITSRLLIDATQQVTEALLFLNDPAPAAQSPCAPASGSTVCTGLVAGPAGSGTAVDPATGLVRNVFQGVRQNDNTIVFLAVPINAPGTATRIIRIKNVRAAVNGASAPNGQIFAFVSIQNPPSNLQLNSSSVNVAFVQQGLLFAVRSRTGGGFNAGGGGVYLFQCDTFNRDLAGGPANRYSGGGLNGGRSFQVRYREAYAASWKVRDINPALTEPGLQQNIPQNNSGAPNGTARTPESGFYNTGFTPVNQLNRAGRSDTGTRLRLAFSNVPANVRVYVSAGALSSAPAAGASGSTQWAAGGETSASLAAYGVVGNAGGGNAGVGTVIVNPLSDAETGGLGGAAGAYPAGAVQGLAEVPITAGAGTFVWEVFNENPSDIDTASFAVAFAYRPSNNPGLGTISVNGSFAPISTNNKMSFAQSLNFNTVGGDIPRFGDTSTATTTASINVCQTDLLFPFVTNQAGFDTGIAIANTSSDPFGTSTQSGTCTLYYYGASAGGGAAPAPQTTTSPVAAGAVAAFSLSSGGTNGITPTPGFQGYMIAICNFRFAHGFAYISDVGAQKLAHGYLALVMDNAGDTGSVNRTGLQGEGLMQ